MRQTWTYGWAASFFGFVLLGCLIALPFAIQCCSQFSLHELRSDAEFRAGFRAQYGCFASTLLDWPREFRLLVMTTTAAVVCLLSVAVLYLIARTTPVARQSWMPWLLRLAARAIVASFMVGVLLIVQEWLLSYVHLAPGPFALAVLVATSILVASMEVPRLWAIPLGALLFVSGIVAAFLISTPLGISLD